MSIQLDQTKRQGPDKHFQTEWLETNGLGGWSGSTASGCHTRRYHGILVAATKPPTERTVMVSKWDETVVINGERFELGVNDYGDVVHPEGYRFLKSFSKTSTPFLLTKPAGLSCARAS